MVNPQSEGAEPQATASRRRLNEILHRLVKIAEKEAAAVAAELEGLPEVLAQEERPGATFFLVRVAGDNHKSLTDREREVVRLAGVGLHNHQIARELDIKTATVASHLRRVYRKLDVTNRAELVQKSLTVVLSS